jgi:hypothetical protein
MVVTGGLSFAAPDEYTVGRQYRSHQDTDPNQVFFLVYVLDIDEINAQNQSFSVNLYLRLRWKDESLAHSDPVARTMPLEDVWNPTLLLANQKGLVRTSLPEVVSVESEGKVTYRQRYVGTVSQPLLLSEFPRDTHEFAVQFVSAEYGTEELIFLPDTIVDSDDGSEQIIGGAMAETLSLPDWKILSFEAKEQSMETSNDLHTPGFVFTFTAKRHFSYYLRQMILPQILIVMMSWGVFWINPSLAGTQFSLSTTSMLTLIAHRFLLASQLPRLPYMTRMDNFIMLSTIVVFAAFVEVVITSSLAHYGRIELGLKFDRWSRFVFPLIFVCVIGYSFWV